MANLYEPLAISGARGSDGSPVSSGRAWFFVPGSTGSQLTVYSDADGLAVLSQPITLDAAGRATVYTKAPARVQVEDSSGSVVCLSDRGNTSQAPEVEVENVGFTGTILSGTSAGSQGAGGRTSLDAALSSLYASVGGIDGQLQIISGGSRIGAPRPLYSAITDLVVNVKSFKNGSGLAVAGDGLQIDTTGVMAAINYVAGKGGGTVFFPPGNYLIDQPLTNTTSGVSFLGVGQASLLTNVGGNITLLSISGASSFTIDSLKITHSSTSTGSAISITNGNTFMLRNVVVNNHRFGLNGTTLDKIIVQGGQFAPIGADAAGRGIKFSDVTNFVVSGSDMRPSAGVAYSSMEITGSVGGSAQGLIMGCQTAGAAGINFNTPIGTIFVLAGNSIPSGITITGTDPDIRQVPGSNGLDGYTSVQASGGGGGSNFTPDRSRGHEIHLRLTSGGAAVCTLNTPTPALGSTVRDLHLTLRLTAAAGGAITWTFNAPYVLNGGGTTIAGADGSTVTVKFNWDTQTSKWREEYRSSTTT